VIRSTAGFILGALLLGAGASVASTPVTIPSDTMPGPLKEVGYDQRLGERIPGDLPFRDHTGRQVKIGDYFGERPVILALAYYRCPMLCDMVLQGLNSSLKTLTFNPGREFDVLVVSIDPNETPKLAAEARAEILARYGRKGTDAGWHFLTGPQDSITRLAQTVGFRYVYDAKSNQFAHAAGIVVLTPEGQPSRYLLGVDYLPRDLRLALIESADHRIGNVVDQVLLYCFHYDPVIGRYSAVILKIMRLAAAATVVGVVLLILLLRRRPSRPVPTPQGAA